MPTDRRQKKQLRAHPGQATSVPQQQQRTPPWEFEDTVRSGLEQQRAPPSEFNGPQQQQRAPGQPTVHTSSSGTTDNITVPKGWPAPEYIINLDANPKDRWKKIGAIYKTEMKQAMEHIRKTVPEFVFELVDTFGSELDSLLPQPYSDELRGLAEVTEIPVGELFLLNLAYDITAHCTGIVAQSSDGKLLHARNQDMPSDPQFLSVLKTARKMTFTAHFQRRGKTVYSGVTFAGTIGLATGQKPNSFTININERRTGSMWTNILTLLRDHPGSAVCFLVRDALADRDMDYQGVLDRMTYIPMIASCYVIIGGTRPGEGAVISRDRREAVKPLSNGIWKLDKSEGRWYLLQTNNDHWTKPPNIEPAGHKELAEDSYKREKAGNTAMANMGQSNLSPQGLIDVLSTGPVFNKHTLYTTVMTAADPSLDKSWIRDLES